METAFFLTRIKISGIVASLSQSLRPLRSLKTLIVRFWRRLSAHVGHRMRKMKKTPVLLREFIPFLETSGLAVDRDQSYCTLNVRQ